MRIARLITVLALSALLVASSAACSLIGDRLMSPDPPNRELQRESALLFRADWPAVERIRFTREGDRPGFGVPWCVNAVATVDGVDYQVIIGPNSPITFPTGNPPPAPATPPTPLPLTVIYTDKTSEVIG
jgi:hypothetical protein